jgi:hypothetical protein
MTKRSAMTIAGGLVAALLAGVVALAINLGIMRTAGASDPGAPAPNPVVQTITETVKDKAPAKAQAPRTVIVRGPAPASTSTSGGWSESESEPGHEFGPGNDD